MFHINEDTRTISIPATITSNMLHQLTIALGNIGLEYIYNNANDSHDWIVPPNHHLGDIEMMVMSILSDSRIDEQYNQFSFPIFIGSLAAIGIASIPLSFIFSKGILDGFEADSGLSARIIDPVQVPKVQEVIIESKAQTSVIGIEAKPTPVKVVGNGIKEYKDKKEPLVKTVYRPHKSIIDSGLRKAKDTYNGAAKTKPPVSKHYQRVPTVSTMNKKVVTQPTTIKKPITPSKDNKPYSHKPSVKAKPKGLEINTPFPSTWTPIEYKVEKPTQPLVTYNEELMVRNYEPIDLMVKSNKPLEVKGMEIKKHVKVSKLVNNVSRKHVKVKHKTTLNYGKKKKRIKHVNTPLVYKHINPITKVKKRKNLIIDNPLVKKQKKKRVGVIKPVKHSKKINKRISHGTYKVGHKSTSPADDYIRWDSPNGSEKYFNKRAYFIHMSPNHRPSITDSGVDFSKIDYNKVRSLASDIRSKGGTPSLHSTYSVNQQGIPVANVAVINQAKSK